MAFAHKGGIHVHAVARDPSNYEHLDPASVGNERRIMVSELSGRATIAERAAEFGVRLEPGGDAEREALQKVKQLESQGFQFEDAAASFELLVRRCDAAYEAPFAPLAYAVDSRKGAEDGGTLSVASAEVAVGGEVLRGEATGNGPVDALEKAVRRALTPAYPYLTRVSLTDFRSHIARPLAGERGPVTVRITGSVPGGAPWTTIASSGDLLHASWLALDGEPRVRGAHARRRQRGRGRRAAPEHRADRAARPRARARAGDLTAGRRAPSSTRSRRRTGRRRRSTSPTPRIARSRRARPRSARRSSTRSATSARSRRTRAGSPCGG